MRVLAEAGDKVAGRYLLKERIGAGGMGIVWRAHDAKLDRQVAVKCARVEDADAARRLRSEARTAARLHHPHIVSVFDHIDDETRCWLVMEYVPSRSLAQIVQAEGLLSPERVAAIGWQIADALAAAHAKGVVHGDVTPENILVTDEGVAKLTDFGIARALWSDATQDPTGGVPGKPRYIAPEVARGAAVSRESDRFSLGASLFAAVEGHSPYGEAGSPMAYIGRALEGHIEAPSRADGLTEPLTALLRRDPKARPTAVETRKLLEAVAPPSEEILRLRGGTGRHVPLSLPPLPVLPARRRVLFAAGAAVAVAAVVTGALLFWPGGSDGPGGGGSGGAGSGAAPGVGATAHPRTEPVAAGTLGEARTADPCALLDTASLHSFGDTELDPAYGNFDRCDIVVSGRGQGDKGGGADAETDVAVTFIGTETEIGPHVRAEKSGNLTVAREPLDGDECDTTLGLPDGNYIQIMARQTGDSAPDLCAMAEAATRHAVAVLAKGPVPRRPLAAVPGSLAHVDACGLLNAAVLTRTLPGVDVARPDAGFGNWECRWSDTAADNDVDLRFDHDGPLDADEGRPTELAGHQAVVSPEFDGDESCTVRIVNRTYQDITGETKVELVQLTLSGPGTVDKLCGGTERLAAAAAAALPKAAS